MTFGRGARIKRIDGERWCFEMGDGTENFESYLLGYEGDIDDSGFFSSFLHFSPFFSFAPSSALFATVAAKRTLDDAMTDAILAGPGALWATVGIAFHF